MDYTKTLSFRDLINYQLKGVESLDRATITRLLPLLKKTEAELRAELDKFSQDQYSHQHRLQTIAHINASINKMEQILLDDYNASASQYYDLGQNVATREIANFNHDKGIQTPNINKTKVSLEQNKFLLNNADASLKTYTTSLRQLVSNAITQGMLAGRTGYEITTNLKKFLDIKKWRLQRIVRTESHKIYNSSKLITYGEFKQEHFPDLMKRLYHPMDHRTGEDSKQLAKLDPAVPLDKPFVFTYKYTLKNGEKREIKRVFMTPPSRPNDRASVVPFRPSWEDDK